MGFEPLDILDQKFALTAPLDINSVPLDRWQSLLSNDTKIMSNAAVSKHLTQNVPTTKNIEFRIFEEMKILRLEGDVLADLGSFGVKICISGYARIFFIDSYGTNDIKRHNLQFVIFLWFALVCF